MLHTLHFTSYIHCSILERMQITCEGVAIVLKFIYRLKIRANIFLLNSRELGRGRGMLNWCHYRFKEKKFNEYINVECDSFSPHGNLIAVCIIQLYFNTSGFYQSFRYYYNNWLIFSIRFIYQPISKVYWKKIDFLSLKQIKLFFCCANFHFSRFSQ